MDLAATVIRRHRLRLRDQLRGASSRRAHGSDDFAATLNGLLDPRDFFRVRAGSVDRGRRYGKNIRHHDAASVAPRTTTNVDVDHTVVNRPLAGARR